jgi:hypothetical protein
MIDTLEGIEMIDRLEGTDNDWHIRRDRWLTHQKGQIMIDILEGTDDWHIRRDRWWLTH